MTELFLKNPIAIFMLSIAVIVFAIVVTPRMSIDTFPELTPPVLVIGTMIPGLGPKDVEKTITWRLEKYVSSTPGVDHVESLSRNSLSIVYVWLNWGTNLNAAQTLVQQQVAFAMAAVPKSLGILPPFVLQYDPANAPVIQVVISGKNYSGPQLYDYAANTIEPLLEGIIGVASASPDGGRQRQINVVVDAAQAQARHLTAQNVSMAVARANALLPSGEFIAQDFHANVYTNAIADTPATLGKAPVNVVDNRAVFIRDVANIIDGGTPATQSVTVDGQEAVYLNILRIPGGNTLNIVAAVKQKIANLKDLPPGVEVKALFDQSTFVRDTYNGLRQEMLQALLLIGLVILIFLQSIRSTLIVAAAIPLSFAATLIVLYATGQTLNAFTLGGLTLAMGRLVDDAVVVLESIHHHLRHKMDSYQAALQGTQAVALPVLASTLTTIAVLLPVTLLTGLAQKLFAPLAITVAVAMVASYFVSMTVTPVLCWLFLKQQQKQKLRQKIQDAIDQIAANYAKLLAHVLPHRQLMLVAAILLVGTSIWAATQLPLSFFPEIDESIDQIYIRFAPGISLATAKQKLMHMANDLQQKLPQNSLTTIVTNLGTPQNARSALVSPNSGPHTGFLRLALSDRKYRTLSQAALTNAARQILNTDFPGVETLQAPGGLVASVFANGYIAPLVIELEGSQLQRLDYQAKAVMQVARSVAGIRDVRSSLQMDYPEIRVTADRQKMGMVGVSLRDVAQTTLDATLGDINEPSVWIDTSNGQSYYVVTAYDNQRLQDTQALMQLPIRVDQNGAAITLGAYSTLKRSLGPIVIERNHLERAAHVLMQLEGRDLGSTANDLEAALLRDPRTQGLKHRFVGQVALMRTTFGGLGLALSLAIMMVFMIMATQFQSLRLPLVMLFTIPVSLVGIVIALMIANQGFSITALMGILMVIGIAVSNGILLIDDANRRLQTGTHKLQAILSAAQSRFVAIMMTSLATIIGLLPTALALEKGSAANQPLALTVVGGLTSSTLLSLFLVPAIYLLLAKDRKRFGN